MRDGCFPERCDRPVSSVHIRLIFIPKYIFSLTLLLPVPGLHTALALHLCSPKLSPHPQCLPSPGISRGDPAGSQSAVLELFLPTDTCQGTCLEHQLRMKVWPPRAVPGSGRWDGKGWRRAALVRVPRNCSGAEGKSRQVAKMLQGGRGNCSGCCQRPALRGSYLQARFWALKGLVFTDL